MNLEKAFAWLPVDEKNNLGGPVRVSVLKKKVFIIVVTALCVVSVDPAVPSCTEGLFLPMFLPPTPAHRTQLYTYVNQTLAISIKAQTLNST